MEGVVPRIVSRNPNTGEVTIAHDDRIIIDYIGKPFYAGRMQLSEETLALLASQPTPRSDIDLSKVIFTPPGTVMDFEAVERGDIKGLGYSDETFTNHPNNGMHYVAPSPSPRNTSFIPRTCKEAKARLAVAKAAIKAKQAAKAKEAAAKAKEASGSEVQVEKVPIVKPRCEDRNPATAAASGDN